MYSQNDLKRLDQQFQDAQTNWKLTRNKTAWDSMFLFVNFAVENSIKKRLKGIKRSDYRDLAMDATIQIMNRYYKNPNYTIQYLPCIAQYAAVQALYNDKQKFQDGILSLDEILENRKKTK